MNFSESDRLIKIVFFSIFMTLTTSGCSVKKPGATPITICQILHWDKSMDGDLIRVKAEYMTDFRHGAFLSDENCPSHHIQLSKSSNDPDKSLMEFRKYLGENYDEYAGVKFKVEILGFFRWNEVTATSLTSPNHRMAEEARGSITIIKILDFEKRDKAVKP